MELRSETAVGRTYARRLKFSRGYRCLAAAAWLAAGISAALPVPRADAAELRYEVRHERFLRDHRGFVIFDDQGLTFQRVGKDGKPADGEEQRWAYSDIQQLWLSPGKLVVLTYQDRKWLFGSDREFELHAVPGVSFDAAYALLKDRLDRRFIAALADTPPRPDWQLRVKRLGSIKGSEGILVASDDRLVYQTVEPQASRTWRFEDIDNVSTSGPYRLTITTHERAILQYGSMKAFNFQLKEPLDEARFETLWKRLQRGKGLSFLSAIEEGPQSGGVKRP
jgi:hypothetical protein